MNRRDFLKLMGLFGVGGSVAACADDVVGLYDDFDVNFDGSVIVVGAGAAGIGAGYLLQRYGIEYEILEAKSDFGGRVKRDETLADFPIDIGAEWIHVEPSILAQLIDDSSVEGVIDVVVYAPESISSWQGGNIRDHNFVRNYYSEWKFKSTTWFGFLERYFMPSIADRITYNSPVTDIDTSGAQVVVRTADGQERSADRVIVTVPIKVLQDGLITFTPALTEEKVAAISDVDVPNGLKVFIDFERRFYPDLLIDGPVTSPSSFDKLYYNAAFRKETELNVLGLFWVAHSARRMTDLNDEALIARVIDELDARFDGAASRNYIDHRIQNWSADPFIRGAYSVDFFGDQQKIVRELRRPIDGRVHFAGEALSIADQATVHGAMLSGYATVERVLVNEG